MPQRLPIVPGLLTCAVLAAAGCGAAAPAEPPSPPDAACAAALAPVPPGGPLADRVAGEQSRAREADARRSARALEALAQSFLTRARLGGDPGDLVLADQALACLERRTPPDPEQVALMRGHVLHQQHRFREAEAVARALVASRGVALDYGLLGDALMEQGRLDEAAAAWQRMMDLKPFYQSYTRAAHLRWLRGDVEGAREAMRLAAAAASPRDPEAVAWAWARLGAYELQDGHLDRAAAATEAALRFRPGYAPALLVQGRVLLARGRAADAIAPLQSAAAATPLPEYQWTLADALVAAGRPRAAADVEAALDASGAARDPRTYALYLATRGRDPDTAVDLARRELHARRDVFTHDALAWALRAAGRVDEAAAAMGEALVHGTADARLFLHAGAIAADAGRLADARRWLDRAAALAPMLLPSEQDELRRLSRTHAIVLAHAR